MKIQNWKSRRSLASLLVLPLMTSGMAIFTSQAAEAGSSSSSSSSSKSYSSPSPSYSSPSKSYSSPSPSYSSTPSKPSTPAPAPAAKPDYSGGSRDYYKPSAPAQAAKTDTTPKSYDYSRPSTQTPAQRAPEPRREAPVFKYDTKPAPITPAQRPSMPMVLPGLPQPTVKTNSAPISTFQGKPYQSAHSDGNGKIAVKNEQTGKSTIFNQKTGEGTTTNKTGTVTKDFRQANDGYVYNKVTFKGATGDQRTREYKTMPTSIPTVGGGTRVVTKYVPRDSQVQREIIYRDNTSMDYMWMYLLINQANHNNYNSGGAYYPSSPGGNYAGGGVTVPAPPKIASGFEINWGKKFEVVPDIYHGDGTMTYTNPADAIAAYVSLDIINDNSEVPTFWGKVAHYASFGLYDHTKNLKKFEFDTSARTPLTQQVTMMAADMLKNPVVDLKAVIDEKTGELVKDAAGNAVTYYFVVDPSNANEVKDAETQASCKLAVATILRPLEAVVSGDLRFMKMKVLGGGRAEGACKAKQVVMVDQTDLEEMNNDLAAKIDEAIHALPKMSKPIYK